MCYGCTAGSDLSQGGCLWWYVRESVICKTLKLGPGWEGEAKESLGSSSNLEWSADLTPSSSQGPGQGTHQEVIFFSLRKERREGKVREAKGKEGEGGNRREKKGQGVGQNTETPSLTHWPPWAGNHLWSLCQCALIIYFQRPHDHQASLSAWLDQNCRGNMPLGMSRRIFPEIFNWGMNTHPRY